MTARNSHSAMSAQAASARQFPKFVKASMHSEFWSCTNSTVASATSPQSCLVGNAPKPGSSVHSFHRSHPHSTALRICANSPQPNAKVQTITSAGSGLATDERSTGRSNAKVERLNLLAESTSPARESRARTMIQGASAAPRPSGRVSDCKVGDGRVGRRAISGKSAGRKPRADRGMT